MRAVAQLVGAFGWLWGVILAKGFWWTAAALFIPFVGWYFTVKHLVS